MLWSDTPTASRLVYARVPAADLWWRVVPAEYKKNYREVLGPILESVHRKFTQSDRTPLWVLARTAKPKFTIVLMVAMGSEHSTRFSQIDSRPGYGTVGYCFGGSLAWLSACELPITAAVGYYGGQIHSLNDRDPAAPIMLHFGELDGGIPLDQVGEIAKAHPDVDVYVYEGAQHGFSCDARGSFHPLSAAIALGRTLDFFVSRGVKP